MCCLYSSNAIMDDGNDVGQDPIIDDTPGGFGAQTGSSRLPGTFTWPRRQGLIGGSCGLSACRPPVCA